MSSPHDFERRLTDWLGDQAPMREPEGLTYAVLARTRHARRMPGWLPYVTRQRRAFAPARRFNTVGNMFRFAALMAAIVLASVAGLARLSSNLGVGTSGPPSQSASPSPAATPMALPNVGSKVPVPLAAGTYSVATDPSDPNAPLFVFTAPAGWSTHEAFVDKGSGTQQEVMFTIWVVTDIFSDACHWSTLVHAGSTIDDLVHVLSQQAGRTASSPTDVTVDGYPAKMIELTVPADLNRSTCTDGNLRFWPDPGPDLNGGLCCDLAGNIDDVYAIDINGYRLVMIARHYQGSSDADKTELQAIVDSVQIVPVPATQSPAPSAPVAASGSPASPSPVGG